MPYSNNYSKFIEELKFEKNQKAFREQINSTKEKKNENIYIEDAFVKKSDNIEISLKDVSASDKAENMLSLKDNTSSSKNDDISLSSEFSFTNKNNTIVENESGNIPDKEKLNVNNEFITSSKDGVKTYNETIPTSKNEKASKIKKIESFYSSKIESDLNQNNEFSLKNELEFNNVNSTSVKTENDLTNEITLSDKKGEELKDSRSFDDKDSKDIYRERIEEIKNGKRIKDYDKFGNKKSPELDYIIAVPKKDERIKPEIYNYQIDDKPIINAMDFAYPLTRRKEEEMYAENADEYSYYPYGTYSQQRSVQSGAINDAFKTITNPSNWDSLGKGIVNSLKVATDVVDMLNLVGPSTNIYTSFTANNLRWDLALKDKNTGFGEKKESSKKLDIEKKDFLNKKNLSVKGSVNLKEGKNKEVNAKSFDLSKLPDKEENESPKLKKKSDHYLLDSKDISEKNTKNIKGRTTYLNSTVADDVTEFVDGYQNSATKKEVSNIYGDTAMLDHTYFSATKKDETAFENGNFDPNDVNRADFRNHDREENETKIKGKVIGTIGHSLEKPVITGEKDTEDFVNNGNVTSEKDEKFISGKTANKFAVKNSDGTTGYANAIKQEYDLTKDISEKDETAFKEGNFNPDKDNKANAMVLRDQGYYHKKIEGSFEDEDNKGKVKSDDNFFSYFRKSERWFDEPNRIGHIYVIPPFRDLARTALEANDEDEDIRKSDVAFKIPLQNNLKFEQMSRGASWSAIQFFGRIGDVQQYSRTGSMDLLSVTTKYFVDGDGDNDFTMAKLQDIEMAYRSLVLPAEVAANYANDGSETANKDSRYYYFTRPPVINVVLAKGKDGNYGGRPFLDKTFGKNAYKNLFTDIKTTYNPDGNWTKYSHDLYYKNFVVTNVTIDKNQDEYNYYIKPSTLNNDYPEYLDTMGFTVTLTLLEIDGNYLGSMPSFNNYFNTISSRSYIKTNV